MKRGSFSTKAFKAGGYSVLLIVLVLAVAVVLNLVAGELPSTWTKLDTSDAQLFTLSQQTKDLAAGLEEDVTITLVVQTGMEDATIQALLERYSALSPHIKLQTKDPVLYPTFTQKYTTDAVYNNSVVVESAKRAKFVSYNDIYQVSYQYAASGYGTSTEFAGESALTSALDYVLSDDLPTVYNLVGHGEAALEESTTNSIKAANLELSELNLLTVEAVPADTGCVLLNSPAQDLTADEVKKLASYLRSGGRLLLLTSEATPELPNLAALLADYGVEARQGMVLEGDGSYCLQGYPHYLLPEIKDQDITSPLLKGSYYVCAPMAQGIGRTEETDEDVTVTSLLTTSASAYLKADGRDMETLEKQEGDVAGPFDVGVAISKTLEDGEGAAKIVWFSADLLDQTANAVVSGTNMDLVLNSINWLAEKSEGITIHAKSMSSEYLTVSAFDSGMWTIIFVFLLPLGFLAAGIVVWYRRKKR